VGTLKLNFSLTVLDLGVPPAWQVLGLGLLFTLAAAGRQAFRVKAARLQPREVG
jgi:predicted signal transduction protein with EAL and GGDEF domain